MQDRGAKGTTDWRRYEIDLSVATGAKNISFGVLHTGDGSAWFAGLAVEVDGVSYADTSEFDLDFESPAPKGFNTGGSGYQVQFDNQILHRASHGMYYRATNDHIIPSPIEQEMLCCRASYSIFIVSPITQVRIMIIGRNKEKAILARVLQSQGAELLVVYGRRRVGKTFLIESFVDSQKCIFFHVVGVQKGSIKEHLKEFSKEIGRVFYGGAKIEASATWMQAFEALNNAINHQNQPLPVVLFFDEFPWLATPRSGLLQALEYYWNRFWKNDKRIKLIVCGSSASWIVKKIIRHRGGLHNRITEQINLKPFTLAETKLFLDERGIRLSTQQVLELYFVVGGVPYYLTQIQKNLSVAENINNLCFKKDERLFDEFDKLFSSLFDDAETYEELIRVIARNRHGISREEIERSIKHTKKGGTLTKRLQDLEMAGFIKGFLPVGHSKKGLFYRILDEYSLFYLQWIEPEKHNIELEIEDSNFWLEIIKSSRYQSWRGYAFESVCYKHVASIKKALGIKIAANIGAWRYVPRANEVGPGAQIDLLFDRTDDAVTICEIKYSDSPFIIDKNCAEDLTRLIDVFRTVTRSKKQVFIAMITANGLKQNTYSKELVNAVVSIDDLCLSGERAIG
ncbi:ATP-binding protein [soil metagenome]